jgi:nicotinate-nucleotide adenylyltransferase
LTLVTVGVVGGTFDPVHVGHLHVARQVRSVFGLERVLLVPCALQPHKPKGPRASGADRLAMVELAVDGEPGLEASALEVERGGVSYTIDTLDALRSQDRAPLFIVGLDSVADLPTWHEHERLLSEYDLVAVDRPGCSVAARAVGGHPALARRLQPVAARPGAGAALLGPGTARGGRIFHVAIPPCDVSSSLVRSRILAHEPITDLVPPRVARYIQDHGLYGGEVDR